MVMIARYVVIVLTVKTLRQVKEILVNDPPNDRSRFFDFDIDPDGLKVNVL